MPPKRHPLCSRTRVAVRVCAPPYPVTHRAADTQSTADFSTDSGVWKAPFLEPFCVPPPHLRGRAFCRTRWDHGAKCVCVCVQVDARARLAASRDQLCTDDDVAEDSGRSGPLNRARDDHDRSPGGDDGSSPRGSAEQSARARCAQTQSSPQPLGPYVCVVARHADCPRSGRGWRQADYAKPLLCTREQTLSHQRCE